PDEVGGHHLSQGLFIIDDQHPPRGRGGGRCVVSHRPSIAPGRGNTILAQCPAGKLLHIFKHHHSTAVTPVPHPGPAASPLLVGSAGATRDFHCLHRIPGAGRRTSPTAVGWCPGGDPAHRIHPLFALL